MSKQLELFENEGYLQGYSPKGKKEREVRRRAHQPISEPQQAEIASGGVIPCRTGSEQAERLFRLLSDGRRYSVVDITKRLNIGDPRLVIRDLRKAGIKVCDVWEQSPGGNRYKSYWIRKG